MLVAGDRPGTRAHPRLFAMDRLRNGSTNLKRRTAGRDLPGSLAGLRARPVQCPDPPGRRRLPAGELLSAALICLPFKGVEVALGHGRLLGAQGPLPKAGNPLS
jgi:hypothetical protein